MWRRWRFFERHRKPSPVSPDGGFECFDIRLANGCFLGTGQPAAQAARPIHCAIDPAQGPRIILCIPDRNRNLGFLLATDARRITAEGETDAGTAISTRLERGPADASASLLHPLNPAWRLGQTETGRSGAAVSFLHRVPDADCTFTLQPIDTNDLPVPVKYAAQEIANAVTLPGSWETIVSAIRTGSLRRDLASAILRCLPIDELSLLATKLAEDEAVRGLVRLCLQGDPWMSKRLEQLLEWKHGRDGHAFCSGKLAFADADDIPGSGTFLAHRPKLGLALNALVRRATRARRMACVVGSARNEGPYLLDWIAHHRAIGFEHVFLYTNDNTDGSDELLGLLARAGAITWLDNQLPDGGLPQFHAYAHALSILPQILDYRWTLIADLDEYFACDVEKFGCVQDYLAWQEIRRAEAIALPWLIYVAGRNDAWRDASCMERFPNREANVNHHVKSMFRTNLHWSSSCHNPLPMLECPITYLAQNRSPHVAKSPENNMALAHNPQATHAWLAHYIFKSAPEAMMKIARGKGDTVLRERQVDMARVMKPFLTLSGKSDLVLDQRTAKCARGMAMEMSRLRGIKGVYDCERSIKARFRADMTAMCMRFVREGRIEGEDEACTKFRSLLQKQSHDSLFANAIEVF